MSKSNLIWLTLILLVLAFGNSLLEQSFTPYALELVVYAGINIILAVSLNLVNGFTGQFSMGHAGFMAIGAYASGILTIHYRSVWGLMPGDPLGGAVLLGSLLAGGLAAAAAGCLVGIPTLRLKGDYLAIVTLGLGEIIRVVILNLDSVGGARGLTDIPQLTTPSLTYAVAIFSIFFICRVLRSAKGRALLSVREDEIAAQAAGVDTTKAKILAFIIGAFFAGAAGGLYAHQLSYINPGIFDFNKSIEIVIMVVLGGMGSISGSVVAAIFVTALPELLRPLQDLTGVDLRMIIYSLSLIILMLIRPKGLFGNKEIFDFLPIGVRRKFAASRGV